VVFLEGAGLVFAFAVDFFTTGFFAAGFFAEGFFVEDFSATGFAFLAVAALGLAAVAGLFLAADLVFVFWAMAMRNEECRPAFRGADCFLADKRPGKLRGGF
jgi:hypothetical protein